MQAGKLCGRPVYVGDRCICHCEKEQIDVNLFRIELDKLLADEEAEYYDLTRFVIPLRGYELPRGFDRDVYFEAATFNGGADFCDVKFHGVAKFSEAEFLGLAGFRGAKFRGVADFFKAKFSGEAEFDKAQFIGEAKFGGAAFSYQASFVKTEFSAKTSFVRARFRGRAEFIRATFSSEADFLSVEFSDQVGFRMTGFSGKAQFGGVKFSVGARFSSVRFYGAAIFTGSEFLGDVNFDAAVFSGLSTFRDARFRGNTTFVLAVFRKAVEFRNCSVADNAHLLFDGWEHLVNFPTMFHDDADFTAMQCDESSRFIFRKVSLSNCRFLETDVTRIQFTDVVWALRQSLIEPFARKAIRDEFWPDPNWLQWDKSKDEKSDLEPPRFQHNLIAAVYRQLQANYIRNFQYAEAGDFYIGEQEAMRRATTRWHPYYWTNWLYRIVSYYGESFLRPFAWLLLTVLVFPAILLLGGVNLDTNLTSPVPANATNYDWSWLPSDFLLLRHDYWDVFWLNLSFVSFDRSIIGRCLFEPYQRGLVVIETVLIVTLVTFFLLALRRAFKRKSF